MRREQTMPNSPQRPRRGAARVARRVARRGFTMLEILVVIGIITLLVGIGVIAFHALDQSPKVTKTTLGNCQSMLAEFQAQTSLRDQPTAIFRGSGQVSPATGASLWNEPAVIDPNDPKGNGNVNSGQAGRYAWAAVANTQLVFQFLNRFPANKQILTKLPSKQILGVLGTGDDRGKLLGVAPAVDPPLILDAWNNPIIFVGRDGLAGVNYDAKKKGDTPVPQRVTSAGLFDYTGGPLITTGLPQSRRPFFASAGPDGDFRTGDDNVYSFEQ